MCKITRNANRKYSHCYLPNARRFRSKFAEIFEAISAYEYDVIAICESNLTCDVNSEEYFPENYNVHRKYRKYDDVELESGGAVLLACKDFNSPNSAYGKFEDRKTF